MPDSWAKTLVPTIAFHTGMAPVSYTHLDVYKRQVWLGGVTIVRSTSESVGAEPLSESLERTLDTATPPS